MKHFLYSLAITLIFSCQITHTFAQSTKRVLFLGNSYTHVNNLPKIIADAALSMSDTLVFDSHTPGGYKLLQHSTNLISQSKIMAGAWDYVVLQGQSQEPITDESGFSMGAKNLKNLIKQYNSCAVPLLYMTWGRKNGDAINCPVIPIMCTYEGMDTIIKKNYLAVAEHNRTEVSPVSVVWKYLRYNYPSINLYQVDESHPSEEGSYAAACCFYTMIFKKDPSLIAFNYSLNPIDAAIIRNAVKINVFDSLSLWDFKKLPIADFTYNIGSGLNEVVFTNTSQHTDNYFWNFGDAITSTLKSPTHSYASNGTYTITLTSSNCDLQGLHSSVIDTNISFCSHTPTIFPDTLMLCPISSDTLWTQAGTSYQWYNNGVLIPGATNQFLVDSCFYGNVEFDYPSVLTTNAGCSELSKQSYVGINGWMGNLIIGFYTTGNVLSGDSVCAGETLKLITGFGGYPVTQWYKNGLAIPFANSDTLVVTNSGTYKVKITHPLCSIVGGYSDSVAYEFINCIDVGLITNEKSFSPTIFPNPVSESFTINFKTYGVKDQIKIFNSIGILMSVVNISESTQINISNFPNGLYFIHFKNLPYYPLKFIKQ